MIKITETFFMEIYTLSHLKEMTSLALTNEFIRMKRTTNNGEALDFKPLVRVFLSSDNKSFRSKDGDSPVFNNVQDFIDEQIKIIRAPTNTTGFTLQELKDYLFFFFMNLHNKDKTCGITDSFLKNVKIDKDCKGDYTVFKYTKNGKEEKRELTYHAALDKYLADLIHSRTSVHINLDGMTNQEIERLRKELENAADEIKNGQN